MSLLLMLVTLARLPALLTLNDPGSQDPPRTDPPPNPEGLGEGGRRAIEAERQARQAAEARARETEAELERLRDANRSETEKAIAAARREGEKAGRDAAAAEFGQQRADLQRRRTADRVALAATGRLADPQKAAGFLNLDALAGDDGEPDDAKIGQAIDQLVATVAGQTPPAGGSTPPARVSPPRSYGAGEQGPRPKADAGTRAERVEKMAEAVKQRTGIS